MPGNINTQYFQSDVLKPAAVAWAESMSIIIFNGYNWLHKFIL